MTDITVTDAEAEFAKLLFPSLRTLAAKFSFPTCPSYPGARCPGPRPPLPACPATLPPPKNCGMPKQTVTACLPAAQGSMGWHSSAIGMKTLEAPDWGPGVSSSPGPAPPSPAPRARGCQGGNRQTLLSLVDQSTREGVTSNDGNCKSGPRIVAQINERIPGQNGIILQVNGFIGIIGR